MQIPDILTARVRLIALTPELLEIQENSPQNLSERLGVHVPPSWPNKEWEPHVYTFIREQFWAHPHTIGWHRYVILPGASPTLIGALGAHPKRDGEVEIGYGILDDWQRQGYATEASIALMNMLWSKGVSSIIAHTFPAMPQSIRVMEKCGMVFDGPGEEEGTVRYCARVRTKKHGSDLGRA